MQQATRAKEILRIGHFEKCHKMNFTDDRIAKMYRTEAPQQNMTKAYSGLYKREFTEEDKMETAYRSQSLATAVKS